MPFLIPKFPGITQVAAAMGLLFHRITGSTFRYGIYIRTDCWYKRKLIVHELVHTMQYERLGGFSPFIKHYVHECITAGYPNGPLEQEARQLAAHICSCH
jgi:hypothetical protein